MSAPSMPFERTSCACWECAAHCRRAPGMLGAGDPEAIAAHLGISVAELAPLLDVRFSLAIDSRSHRLKRIAVLVPKRAANGACQWLTADRLCAIHAVSPAGCRFFDAHQEEAECDRRSAAIHEAVIDSPSYEAAVKATARLEGEAAFRKAEEALQDKLAEGMIETLRELANSATIHTAPRRARREGAGE